MPAIDLHQHLWPEPFLELLRSRTFTPYLRGTTLYTAHDRPYDVDPADHDVERRIALDRGADVGLACVSLSAPLGIESLPHAEAAALIDAWQLGAAGLPGHFAPWASVPAVDPDLDGLALLLSGRFVGVQLPATQLATPDAWLSVGEVLRVAELARKPVFIHPGPVTAEAAQSWWAPVVGYIAQMQAAWWGWQAFSGRSQFPGLRLVFAAGAGLAPVQHERLAARGGRLGAVDPHLFVDTSSYGVQALDALSRALGIDAIVLGSDRPYAEPVEAVFGDAATQVIRVDNPRRALGAASVDVPEEAVA